MITVQLCGGLGNQLFQIFTLISYAMDHSVQFIFPYSEGLWWSKGERKTYWKNFLKSLIVFTTENKKYKIDNVDFRRFYVIREPYHHYAPIPVFDFKQNVSFQGYFQSYQYFYNNEKKIMNMIRLVEQQHMVRYKYSDYLEQDKHIVSMHFRLGDYKDIQEYHNLLPLSYYEKALNYLFSVKQVREQNLQVQVLYFCEKEDNSTVEQFIEELNSSMDYSGLSFVKVDDEIVDWEQMLLMSCCNSHIIANSSFSWWGAYFNTSEDKVVCYPSLWFGPRLSCSNNTDSMFPPSWNRILL
jgi:hypothetical protein